MTYIQNSGKEENRQVRIPDVKYGLIAPDCDHGPGGLFSMVFFGSGYRLGVACYFVIPKTDLEYEYLVC